MLKKSWLYRFIYVFLQLLTFIKNAFNVDSFFSYFSLYCKLVSPFFLYFWGRLFCSISFYACCSFLKYGYIVVFIINIIFFYKGFQIWGDANTFSGLFYYKTDMALSIVALLTFILVSPNFKFFSFIGATSILILLFVLILSNSRISYFVFFNFICFIFSSVF